MVGSRFIRRVFTWALLGLYGLVASGLPLPLEPLPFGRPSAGGARGGDRVADARLAAKDRSRPFPCMDKPCGCATAEQCFANCCCHTPAERLAWARAHRVEPAVLAALERRVVREEIAPPRPPSGSCCATAAAEPPCCGGGSTDECARAENPTPGDDDADQLPAAPAGRVQTVVLRALLACGGLAAEWFALGGGGLPPAPVEYVPRAGLDEPLVVGDETPFRLAAPPAAPPPRAV